MYIVKISDRYPNPISIIRAGDVEPSMPHKMRSRTLRVCVKLGYPHILMDYNINFYNVRPQDS